MIKDIFSLSKIANKNKVGIYFLWDNNNLVYIGKSTDIDKRICEHKTKKQFTHWNYIPELKKNLDRAEKKYIETYSPQLNQMLNIKIIPKLLSKTVIEKNNTGKFVENIFYCKIENLKLQIQVVQEKKNSNNFKFIGYQGYLKQNAFNNSLYGELKIISKKYFIIFDEKNNEYELK